MKLFLLVLPLAIAANALCGAIYKDKGFELLCGFYGFEQARSDGIKSQFETHLAKYRGKSVAELVELHFSRNRELDQITNIELSSTNLVVFFVSSEDTNPNTIYRVVFEIDEENHVTGVALLVDTHH